MGTSAMLGVVIIGRNEGDRLVRCLASVDPGRVPIVYVDSGSTDASVANARAAGALVQVIDPTLGFTAARARNLGWRHLLAHHPQLQYVQFVDGDCEVDAHWLIHAQTHLVANPHCAGVCGRRRERFPEATLYNGLCDVEWNTPIGPALATGGDAMFRVDALQAVAGYRDTLIAGEEPEMCLRMREKGWTLARLDHEMTLHDAAMTRFGQWWKRSVRTGHAFAEGHFLHGGRPHHHYDAENLRILLWGLALPLLIVLGTTTIHPFLASAFAIYPVQVLRLAKRLKGDPRVPAALVPWQAAFFVLGKFPELMGLLQFHGKRLLGVRGTLIEYK